MRVFVIGASGYIGGAIAEALEGSGKAFVTITGAMIYGDTGPVGGLRG